MSKEAKELLKKNNISEKQILKENDEIYTNMIVYLRGADITEYNQEKVREDLIAMIVDGQERGDDIQKVMGDNYKEICDEIIAEMPKKTTKEKVMDAVMMTLDILWIMGIISVIKTFIFIKRNDIKEMYFVFMLGDLISWCVIILVANVIVERVCKNSFKEKETKKNKVISFLGYWLACLAVGCLIVIPIIVFDTVLFTVHIGVALVACVVVFAVSKLLAWKY